jgi:pyridoxal/pyridoxine/pyridoxamine kinase
VLGDDGKCYCPPELIQRFKQQLLPQAFIITPNSFEAQLLTGALHACSLCNCVRVSHTFS